MLKVAVCVSGGGTNLQAILDSVERGDITNAEIAQIGRASCRERV